jgi:cholesterol oxidase
MDEAYDAVVVGSGFGGAVTACRLSEHGYRVLVLERGRRWGPDDYPREPGDAWVWDQDHPARRNGWLDLRLFPTIGVAQGAGVGGGLLIYANIVIDAKPELFEDGWPPEISYEKLRPYYETVAEMMGAQQVPLEQWPERTHIMQEAAEAIGHSDRFRRLDLAVTFDRDWRSDQPDAYTSASSKTWQDAHGRQQGTCVHLGNCDIGCDVAAKNTLDLNYLAEAERHGAEIAPLHLVREIGPHDGGYTLRFDQIVDGRLTPGSVRGRIVVLAAGSLGSTELLLRNRDQYRTLPNVSRRLGACWSSNGDLLTPAIHGERDVSPTRGPTITSAIDFLDGSEGGQHFLIEDGGFPDLVGNWLKEVTRGRSLRVRERAISRTLQQLVEGRDPMKHVMPWFAQGRDAADGDLKLRRRWFGLFGRKRLHLDWDIDRSEEVIDAIVDMHERLARASGGTPIVPPTWTWAKLLVTPHPLGGCNMAETPQHGVVNHRGEVFGHDNLYVADGAIIPEAIGANPSKTIAALAERISGLIVAGES